MKRAQAKELTGRAIYKRFRILLRRTIGKYIDRIASIGFGGSRFLRDAIFDGN